MALSVQFADLPAQFTIIHKLAKKGRLEEATEQLLTTLPLVVILVKHNATEHLSQNVQSQAWNEITALNSVFRRKLARLTLAKKPVEQRKVRQKYLDFLVGAQNFYVEFVCATVSAATLDDNTRTVLAHDRHFRDKIGLSEHETNLSPRDHHAVKCCYDSLVYLGDLSRYREQIRANNRKLAFAIEWHSLAVSVLPYHGFAYHQRALVYKDGESIEDKLKAIDDLAHAASAGKPDSRAKATLQSLLGHFGWMVANNTAEAKGFHPLLRPDSADWSSSLEEGRMFEQPFVKGGFSLSTEGLTHIDMTATEH